MLPLRRPSTPSTAAAVKERPARPKACFSFAAYSKNVIQHLGLVCHVPILEGLTEDEFACIEHKFGFRFPPDLKSILQEGLPDGQHFPNWRSEEERGIRALLELPISALRREIAQGHYWCPLWGEKPSAVDNALAIAIPALKTAPTLIPIYSNCYISCFPRQAGNPIFLVHGGTIQYCGYDIADFFRRQAFVPRQWEVETVSKNANDDGIEFDMTGRYAQNATDCVEGTIPKLNTSKTDVNMAAKPNPTWRWAADSPRTPDMHVTYCSTEKTQPKYLYYHEQALPSRMLTEFTMSTPPWVASEANRIDFWSDVAIPLPRKPTPISQFKFELPSTDRNHMHCLPKYTEHPCEGTTNADGEKKFSLSDRSLFRPVLNDVGQPLDEDSRILTARKQNDVATDSGEGSDANKHDSAKICTEKAQFYMEDPTIAWPTWLSEYLEVLGDVLRRGRWREPDIREMLMTPSAHVVHDLGGDMDGDCRRLALGIYAVFLGQAGWKDEEITHMLS